MEVILFTIFSVFIIMMTVYFMLKAYKIGYKRKQVTYLKYWIYSITTVMIGGTVAVIVPMLFQYG